MIASESIRMVFSAAPIGPCGSRIFIAEPENGAGNNGVAARTRRSFRTSSIALPRTVATAVLNREPCSQSFELRNYRDAYARRRRGGYPGSLADPARIDRSIVHSTGGCPTPRDNARSDLFRRL